MLVPGANRVLEYYFSFKSIGSDQIIKEKENKGSVLADVTRTSSKAGPRGSLALSICLFLVPTSHHNRPIGLSVCLSDVH